MIEALNAWGWSINKAIYVAAWLVVVFRNLAVIGFFGYRWKEGLWGNIVLAFNFLFAMLIAVNYWEPISKKLCDSAPIGLFFWDGVAFTVLFIVTFIVFILITNKITKVIVVFPLQVERTGNAIVLGFIMGCLFLPLYFFFGHIGPVAPQPVVMAREQKDVDRFNRSGVSPEKTFLLSPYKFMSKGSLRGLKTTNTFNANDDFMERHLNRRCMFFKNLWEKGKSAYSGEIPPISPKQ